VQEEAYEDDNAEDEPEVNGGADQQAFLHNPYHSQKVKVRQERLFGDYPREVKLDDAGQEQSNDVVELGFHRARLLFIG